MNQKGVFITLTALIIGLMLISMSANVQKAREVRNDALIYSLAGERVGIIKENIQETTKEIYSSNGISWTIDNNNFYFEETFPDSTSKSNISDELIVLKEFVFREYSNSTFTPETTDLGKLFVYGKDFNISHSPATGFGTNNDIYLNYSQQFSKLKFDINTSTNINQSSNDFIICSGCANPVDIEVIARENGTPAYSFNSTIDFDLGGSLSIGTTTGQGNEDIVVSITPTFSSIHTDSDVVNLGLTTTFNDAIFEAEIDKEILEVDEINDFGFKG